MTTQRTQKQRKERLEDSGDLPWTIPAYRIRIRGVDNSTPQQVKAAIKSSARVEDIEGIQALVLEDNKGLLLGDDIIKLRANAYVEFYQARGKPVTKNYHACLPPL
jgi:hypothetical protein